MTDMYKEGHSSKKKFLVPLVVLMFCAVALTGAAYAYNSTLSASGNVDNSAVLLTFDGTYSEEAYKIDVKWNSKTENGNATEWTAAETAKHVATLVVDTNVTAGLSKAIKIKVDGITINHTVVVAAVGEAGGTIAGSVDDFTITGAKDNEKYTITITIDAGTSIANPTEKDAIQAYTISATYSSE